MCIIYLAVASAEGKVPYSNALIICCAYQVFSIRVEHYICDPIIMPRQGQHTAATAHVEYTDLLVSGACCYKVFQLSLFNFILFLNGSIDLDALIWIDFLCLWRILFCYFSPHHGLSLEQILL